MNFETVTPLHITHYLKLKLQELEIFEAMNIRLADMRKAYEKFSKKKFAKSQSVYLEYLNNYDKYEAEIERYESAERTRACSLLAYRNIDGHTVCVDNAGNICQIYDITLNNDKQSILDLIELHTGYNGPFVAPTEDEYIIGEFDENGDITGTPHVEPEYEVIKFELYGDPETYYCLSEMDMQTFAEWEGKEVFTYGIELNGMSPACLPLTENKCIFINYSK